MNKTFARIVCVQHTSYIPRVVISRHFKYYLATVLRDGTQDVHHLLEKLPLAGELSIHVVVEEDLNEAVGGLEPPEQLVQHRNAPGRRHLEKSQGEGGERDVRGGG